MKSYLFGSPPLKLAFQDDLIVGRSAAAYAGVILVHYDNNSNRMIVTSMSVLIRMSLR